MAPDQRASTGAPPSEQAGAGGDPTPTESATSACVSIDHPSLWRETMYDLGDQGSVERPGQNPGVREVKRGERVGRVPGVPHQEDVVADHGNPVEPHVAVDAPALVVVLDECEPAGTGIDVVLQARRREDGGERSARQPRRGRIGRMRARWYGYRRRTPGASPRGRR